MVGGEFIFISTIQHLVISCLKITRELTLPAANYLKTRIAPTPSGFLHLGNVLSFAITAELARRNNAKILLRIDDMDRERVNEQYLQDVFDTLSFLEIEWHEGPRNIEEFEAVYSQLNRLPLYNMYLDKLCQNGKVYACNCSRKKLNSGAPCNCFDKKLPLDTPDATWRFVTGEESIEVKSYNGEMISAALPTEMRNFIVRKKDGFPAYQLTSVADDLFYGADLIVRGNDLWPSTLAQHVLAKALGRDDFGNITFYHHPLLTTTSGEKLSKSAGDTSVKYLREHGSSPAVIYSMIAQMMGISGAINNWQQLAGKIISLP